VHYPGVKDPSIPSYSWSGKISKRSKNLEKHILEETV
jgi:hypothetical protein